MTSASTWHELASACPYATFFHTPYWAEMALAARPGSRDATVVTRLSSGVRVLIPILELRRRARGLARELISTGEWAYGGPIADGPIDREELAAVLAALGSWDSILTMVGNPMAPPLPAPPGFDERRDSTQVMPLEDGYEALRLGFSKGHKSAINKALRNGVEVRQASSVDDYRAYYEMYLASIRRWAGAATSSHPWELFEAGRRVASRRPGLVRLWLAEVDGELAAGAWTFTWNSHTAYWHAAAHEQHFYLRPAQLVVAAIAQRACEEGQRCLDLGASGGHEGTRRFKSGFGPEELPIASLAHEPRALGLASHLNARARRVARRLRGVRTPAS